MHFCPLARCTIPLCISWCECTIFLPKTEVVCSPKLGILPDYIEVNHAGFIYSQWLLQWLLPKLSFPVSDQVIFMKSIIPACLAEHKDLFDFEIDHQLIKWQPIHTNYCTIWQTKCSWSDYYPKGGMLEGDRFCFVVKSQIPGQTFGPKNMNETKGVDYCHHHQIHSFPSVRCVLHTLQV